MILQAKCRRTGFAELAVTQVTYVNALANL
jgi:hypothetical protein